MAETAWSVDRRPAVAADTDAPRHAALVRVTHWLTTVCFLALLVSGLEIVVSHPRFYRGESSNVLTPGDLPVAFGCALRLRVPRQLGYKSVKFINRLAVTDSLKRFGKGLGSASPEGGYAWYAGI